MAQRKYTFHEFSGAIQQKTTKHIKKPNEVVNASNVDFWTVLGAARRRPGAQGDADGYELPKMLIDAPVLGAYIARFSSGIEIWAAQNDDAATPTAANLDYWTGPNPDDWTNIKNDLVKGSEINMTDDLDEVWVASYDPVLDGVGDPFTVNSAHDVSTTRHLDFAPKARFYMEFNGSMWAANVKVGSDRFRDRIYKSSGAMGVFAFVRAAATLTQTQAAPTAYATSLEMDSVRYIKAGQVIDVYSAGTETLLYTLTVASVDKALDTVTFTTPDTLTFANTDINTTSNVITVSGGTWADDGVPVTFWYGSALPTGLTQGGVYYVNRLTSTTLTLHPTRADALANTNIVDINSQGTGTHRLTFTPVFGNKDEFWKTGRKGKLSRFWNTDYRTPETSDYLKLPPTLDALNDITAIGKISNRMFIWTENAMARYDGQNLLGLRNDVGCIAQKSIGYYDSFMVWLDAKGNIWIRNEEAGEQDVISEGISDVMRLVPESQLPEATASCVGGIYKLFLGEVDGKNLRVIYNFRTNQWSTEWWTPAMPAQLPYKYDGTTKPHFFDEVGQMWVDEEGDTDNGEVIPMEVELGADNLDVDEEKNFHGVKVWSENSAGTKIFVVVDKNEPVEVGEISSPTQSISFANRNLPKGTMFNMIFTNSASDAPPQIEKAVVWFTREEDTFRATNVK